MSHQGSKSYSAAAVFFTIILFIVAWKLILPGYAGSQAKIAQLDAEIDQATSKKEQLDAARQSLASIDSAYKAITVSVSEDSDEPNIISELESIALKNGLVLPSIAISAGAEAPASSEDGQMADATSGQPIGVSVSVTGTYDQLSAFVAALEKSVKFMNIQSLNYGVSEEDGSISLSMLINAYSRAPKSEALAPEAETAVQ